MTMSQKKQYDDDDGRVICNMDVEGMPWHAKKPRLGGLFKKPSQPQMTIPGEPLTKSEARGFVLHSVLAGLFLVLIFSAVWVIFTLFCIHVWFA